MITEQRTWTRLFWVGALALAITTPVWAQALELPPSYAPALVSVDGDPEPDTTDWRRYFPLEVGNEWQYRIDFANGGSTHYGFEVVGDTILEGESYLRIRTCFDRDPVECTDQDEVRRYTFVRYDESEAFLIQRIEVSGAPRTEWWEHVPCLLDADFGTGPVACAGGQEEYFVSGGYDYEYAITPDTLGGVTYKRFDAISTYTGLVAGIGVIWIQDAKNKGELQTLVYARVGNDEYGTRAFELPAPVAQEPPPLAGLLAPSLFPNPAKNHVTAVFTLNAAEPIVIEAFDTTGRSIFRHDSGTLNAGKHAVRIGLGDLASGMYFVRISGLETRSIPFTVIR